MLIIKFPFIVTVAAEVVDRKLTFPVPVFARVTLFKAATMAKPVFGPLLAY